MSGMRCVAMAGVLLNLVVGCSSVQSGGGGAIGGPDPTDMIPDDTDPDDGMEPADEETGIIVETPVGAAGINLDVFDTSTNVRVEQARSTDEFIALEPGEYRVTEYFDESFVVAPSVQVTAGQVTHVQLGAVHVTTASGSEAAIYDIYDATGDNLLDQVNDTGTIRPVPAGTYVLKEYFNDVFDFARDVVVVEGEVTVVALGAVVVTTASGSEAAIYDIYDGTGEMLLDRVNDTDEIRPLPAGTYVLKEYFNDVFDFARDVVITADMVTTIPLGAVRLITVEGAVAEIYDIYDATGQTLLDRVNDTGVIRPVPAGTYVITEYFNAPLVFASGVVVEPNAQTDVLLGAIRYTGSESLYDIYDGGGETVLARPNDAGEIRTLPAGTFVLKPYFEDTVLADDVVVTAGAITTVP